MFILEISYPISIEINFVLRLNLLTLFKYHFIYIQKLKHDKVSLNHILSAHCQKSAYDGGIQTYDRLSFVKIENAISNITNGLSNDANDTKES